MAKKKIKPAGVIYVGHTNYTGMYRVAEVEDAKHVVVELDGLPWLKAVAVQVGDTGREVKITAGSDGREVSLSLRKDGTFEVTG